MVSTSGCVQVAPEWERLTAHIEADPESKERLGWVREMYAFSTAVALKKIELDIVACPECPLISQVGQQQSSCTIALTSGYPEHLTCKEGKSNCTLIAVVASLVPFLLCSHT